MSYRVELGSGRLDGRVERVETFLSVSSPHSLIMDSRSSTEGSDTFTQGRICKMQLYDYAQVCHHLHPNLSIAFFSSPPLPIYMLYTFYTATKSSPPLHLYTAKQLPHFLKRPTDLVCFRRASRATNQRQARLRWTRSRKSGEANGRKSRIIHPRR